MKYLKIFERFNVNEINDTQDLMSKLKEYSIPVDNWGKGETKTMKHLLDELNNDECFIVDEGGYLVRYIEFVGIKVYYKDNEGSIFELKEDEQIFKDGRVRRRKMQSSVSEKMKFGEDPLDSAIRGIKEELGIDVGSRQLSNRKDISFDGSSTSYPGLKAKYKGHQYVCYLNNNQYNPDGYVEIQEDKSTFFKWISI